MASLGSAYRVAVVGKSAYPYDAEITRYLVQGQEYIMTYDPQTQPPMTPVAGKGMAFLFFFGCEHFMDTIYARYTSGRIAEVVNPVQRHVIYVHIEGRKLTPADSVERQLRTST